MKADAVRFQTLPQPQSRTNTAEFDGDDDATSAAPPRRQSFFYDEPATAPPRLPSFDSGSGGDGGGGDAHTSTTAPQLQRKTFLAASPEPAPRAFQSRLDTSSGRAPMYVTLRKRPSVPECATQLCDPLDCVALIHALFQAYRVPLPVPPAHTHPILRPRLPAPTHSSGV